MWLLCNRVQIKPCNLCPVASSTSNFICLEFNTQKYIFFYVHSQLLSIGTVELVDDSDSQS